MLVRTILEFPNGRCLLKRLWEFFLPAKTKRTVSIWRVGEHQVIGFTEPADTTYSNRVLDRYSGIVP